MIEAKLDGLTSMHQAFTSGKLTSQPTVSTTDSSAILTQVSEETYLNKDEGIFTLSFLHFII